MAKTKTPQPPVTIDNLESQLSDLEARHKRHQALMESQRLARVTARERHYRPWSRRKLAPIHLCY